jgi:hypothetical protein
MAEVLLDPEPCIEEVLSPSLGLASARPHFIRRSRFAEDCDAQLPNVTQKFTLLETEKRKFAERRT